MVPSVCTVQVSVLAVHGVVECGVVGEEVVASRGEGREWEVHSSPLHPTTLQCRW